MRGGKHRPEPSKHHTKRSMKHRPFCRWQKLRLHETGDGVYWNQQLLGKRRKRERRRKMASFTEHYNLIKPGEADYYDIRDWNENMDTIDAAMAAQEESMGEMNEKMGTAADTGTTTINF